MVDKPWDGSASRWDSPASYCSACLIDLNGEGEKVKDLCFLPVREPGGGVNKNAVHAAAAGRGITRIKKPEGVSPEAFASAKKRAANRIISLYARMGEIAPAAIYRIAGKRQPAEKSE
jgi:hypothetical protein